MNLPDTEYYFYSLGGFAPCFFYDFNAVEEFEITLNCQVLVDLTQAHLDSLKPGYAYRDVITPPAFVPQFELPTAWAPELTINFDVRDMKYLSHSNHTEFVTSDPDVMNGLKPLPISLNFASLLEQDQTGETYYVVGGRAYYEITVAGQNTLTFIAKGFFDQEGYSMPAKKASTTTIVLAVLGSVLGVGAVVVGCWCCKKRRDELDRIKGIQKEEDITGKVKN
jgi:hypothetical protein